MANGALSLRPPEPALGIARDRSDDILLPLAYLPSPHPPPTRRPPDVHPTSARPPAPPLYRPMPTVPPALAASQPAH